jgi:Flp pilus assembly protein TadB
MSKECESPFVDPRILAALHAVNPPVEKLMTDRLSLRLEVRRTQQELLQAEQRMCELRYFREVQIPRYIAVAKLASLAVACGLLVGLVMALFFGLFEVKITASLLASLLLPLWLVDLAEQSFGRWRFSTENGFQFVPRHPATLQAI